MGTKGYYGHNQTTFAPAAVPTRTGAVFSGTDFMSVPTNLPPNSDLTVEFWTASTPAPGGIFSAGNNTVGSADPWLSMNAPWSDGWLYAGHGDPYAFVGNSLDNIYYVGSNWAHVALVSAGIHRRVYLNGILADTNDTTAPTQKPQLPINSLDIGAYFPYQGGAGIRGHVGPVAYFRVWNYARTEAQIQATLDGDVSPQAGLVNNYPFQQNLNDTSGNNYNYTSLTGNIPIQSFNL